MPQTFTEITESGNAEETHFLYFLKEIFGKKAIAFQGDSMGHLQCILPKMQWLLFNRDDGEIYDQIPS